jgi:antitoxin FitA
MATLYVENIPDELYRALRDRARRNRKSIAAEVLSLLEENVPTDAELKARQTFARRVAKLRSQEPSASGPFSSAEELIRQDRER